MMSSVLKLLAVAVVLPLTGCTGEDAELLSRAWRTAGNKVHEATGVARNRLSSSLHSLQGDSLKEHVRNRLLHDKELTGITVEILEEEGVVTLDGEVGAEAQKERAVGIAESTVGVEKVVDQLRIRE